MINRSLLLYVALAMTFGCAAKPDAAAVCKKIEAAGLAKDCKQEKPAVINARAKTRYDFDLVHVPGQKGAVLDFANDDDYTATVNAYAAAAMFAGPHRYGNRSTRIFVQLNSGASIEDGNAVNALVSGETISTAVIPSAVPGIPSAEAPAKKSDPVQVAPEELYRDYEANEVAADEKYKGKTFFVTAEVQAINKDALDKMVLELNAKSGVAASLHAQMRDSEKIQVVALTKKQLVLLRCDGGGMVMNTPLLSDCVIAIANVGQWLDQHRGEGAAAALKAELARAASR